MYTNVFHTLDIDKAPAEMEWEALLLSCALNSLGKMKD